MFSRSIEETIRKKLGSGKAIVIMGARQVGKTTLINEIVKGENVLFLDADDPSTRRILQSPSTETLRTIIGPNKYVFIDEAQRIKGIGITLKIITDQIKNTQLFVSGSSSFDLGNEINEPLTGRKWEYELFPISWEEFEDKMGILKSDQQLESRLVYGMYPEVLNNQGNEKEVLKNLVSSYLYKDILSFSDIRKPEVLDNLLQALALQVGNEVNYNELATLVGVNKNTIQKYIDVLEKGYILFKLSSYSRNLRNEIKQTRKIYFLDNGIRNTILGNFTPIDLRTDKGALWENFLIAERRKQNEYKQTFAKMYFWRTRQQQEIDLIEQRDGQIKAYEFKWAAKKAKIPKTFIDAYHNSGELVDRSNFRNFVRV